MKKKLHLTSKLSKAARALAGWTSADLSKMSEVPHDTLRAFESGRTKTLTKMNERAVINAFDKAGIEIILDKHNGAGVRFKRLENPHTLYDLLRSIQLPPKLSHDKEALLKKAYLNSLERLGACMLTNNELIISNITSLRRELFDLPQNAMSNLKSPSLGRIGYTPMRYERYGDEPSAPLETHRMNWLAAQSPKDDLDIQHKNNLFPEHFTDIKISYPELAEYIEEISRRVLEEIAVKMGKEADFFQSMIDGGEIKMRITHYPPIDKNSSWPKTIPHRDFCFISLITDIPDSGLELLAQDKSAWLPIETKEDEITILAGEMMDYVTNGRIPSAIHRVSSYDDSGASRYSTKFFVMGNDEAKLKRFDSASTNKYLAEDPSYAEMTPLQFARRRSEEFQSADLEHFNALPVLDA